MVDEQSFTGHMQAVRSEHEDLRKLYAAAQKEIAELQGRLQRILSGESVTIVIEGHSLTPVADGPVAFDPASLMDDDVRDDLSKHLRAVENGQSKVDYFKHSLADSEPHPKQHPSGVEDSFVL